MAARERFNFQNNMAIIQRNRSSVEDGKRKFLLELEERERWREVGRKNNVGCKAILFGDQFNDYLTLVIWPSLATPFPGGKR